MNKLLIFHRNIAPYRIDFFNSLMKAYNAKMFVYYKNLKSQNFNMEKIYNRLCFTPFLLKGITIFGRPVRFSIFSLIKKEYPDIVITNEYSLNTLLMLLARKVLKRNFYSLTICDDSEEIALHCTGIRKYTRQLVLKYIDGIILCNDKVQQWYSENFPKVSFFYFPILQEELYFRKQLTEALSLSKMYLEKYNLNNKKVILFIGRLVEVKNLPYLIDAFKEIDNNHDDLRLIIVGDGDQKEYLMEYVLERGISEKVIFPGRSEGISLYAWYNIASIFILPSYYEPFGAVVNEALLSGVPVIVSDKAGSVCLINNKNGKVFSIENKRELINHIHNYISISNPILFSELKVKSSLMPFTYDSKIKELIKWINQLSKNEN